MSRDHRGRDGSDVSTSRGTTKIDGEYQKLEEPRKGSPQKVSEGTCPCLHLDFGLLASRTVRQYISVVFKPPSWQYFVTAAPVKIQCVYMNQKRNQNF